MPDGNVDSESTNGNLEGLAVNIYYVDSGGSLYGGLAIGYGHRTSLEVIHICVLILAVDADGTVSAGHIH